MLRVEIFDRDEQGAIAFDLADVLATIEPFNSGLEWYFLEFEPVGFLGATGTESPPAWVSALFQEIKKNPNGIRVEWHKLKDFARHIKQTMDATVIAVRRGAKPPTAPIDPRNPEYEIVVQGIDTSLWAVTSRNQDLIDHLRSAFKETKLVA